MSLFDQIADQAREMNSALLRQSANDRNIGYYDAKVDLQRAIEQHGLQNGVKAFLEGGRNWRNVDIAP